MRRKHLLIIFVFGFHSKIQTILPQRKTQGHKVQRRRYVAVERSLQVFGHYFFYEFISLEIRTLIGAVFVDEIGHERCTLQGKADAHDYQHYDAPNA